jgi:hypothetical protein
MREFAIQERPSPRTNGPRARHRAALSRVASLPPPAKALYTGFCALTALGLATCIALYAQIVRFGTRTTPAELFDHLVAYYNPAAANAPAPGGSITTRALLQVTHFHLFSMSVVLLVIGHLFFLTGLSSAAKRRFVVAAVAATVVHLLSPWGIVLAGRPLAVVYPLSGFALLATYGVLMAVPLYEMWSKQDAVQPQAAPEQAAVTSAG